MVERIRTLVPVLVKGFCMGVADLVPGVSGGTIAFISGIYPRLMRALAAMSTPETLRLVFRLRVREVATAIDMPFLATLAVGILTAIALLAGILHTLLEERAHLLFGFFFGLVAASAIAVTIKISRFKAYHVALLAAGAALAYAVASAPAIAVDDIGAVALFASGAIAICAMILPGISGSFILLLLGVYPHILKAASEVDPVLLAFAAGCGIGLLSFARLLNHLMVRHHDSAVATLVGVMLGGLYKLWPWKESAEGSKIILQDNVMPQDFAVSSDPQVALVVLLAVGGAALVTGITWLESRRRN